MAHRDRKRWQTLRDEYSWPIFGAAAGLIISTPYAVLAVRSIQDNQWAAAGIWLGAAVLMPSISGGLPFMLNRRRREIDAERGENG